jgi:hypothetical protein
MISEDVSVRSGGPMTIRFAAQDHRIADHEDQLAIPAGSTHRPADLRLQVRITVVYFDRAHQTVNRLARWQPGRFATEYLCSRSVAERRKQTCRQAWINNRRRGSGNRLDSLHRIRFIVAGA